MTTRKKLLDDSPEICMGTSTLSYPAIRELYEEIILNLLPKRFPTIFTIKGDIFYNIVTGSRHRISTALPDPAVLLRHLAENVEEDFYLMVPNEKGEFFLQGFQACFPQGLLPLAKVGLSVSEIHAPIPGYEGRLKKGVNRCFERMGRGESVGRLNVPSPRLHSTRTSLIGCSGQSSAITRYSTSHSTAPTPSKLRIAHPKMQTSTHYPRFCESSIIP